MTKLRRYITSLITPDYYIISGNEIWIERKSINKTPKLLEFLLNVYLDTQPNVNFNSSSVVFPCTLLKPFYKWLDTLSIYDFNVEAVGLSYHELLELFVEEPRKLRKKLIIEE